MRVYSLPGPAPKRARRDSDESIKSTVSAKPKKNQQIRNASSSRTQLQATSAKPVSSAAKKSLSVAASVRRSPSRRPGSPETDMDDGASIADSTMSTGRTRRSEAQRLEYYKNEPLCGLLTKDRAECKRCGKSVGLGGRTTYKIRPWEMHRAKCDQTPVAADEDVEDDVEKSKQRAKTVEQRIAVLTADPAISSLKPHEVLCRNCGTWVRLSNSIPYKFSNWKAHALTCQTSTKHQPSDRVAAATRKLRLVNDGQAKSYTEHEVTCAYCDSNISEGERKGDHSLLAWEEHKAVCIRISPKVKKTATVIAPDVSTVPFPSRPPHSSASAASTEATLIASDAKQITHTQGTKRLREEEVSVDGAPDTSDTRPANRARTENHEAPTEEPTSAASWLALPFQAFIRGFKESLTLSAMAMTIPPGQNRPEKIIRRPMPITIPRLFSDDSDDSLTPLSSSPESVAPVPPPHTEAEKAREMELLQDPTAIVLSPYLVRCRTCDATIKLSMKSRFDAYHWRTHRSRCLKKHPQPAHSAPKKQRTKVWKVEAKPQTNSEILRLRPPSRPRSEEHQNSSRTPASDTKGDLIPKAQANSLHPHSTPSLPSPLTPLPPPSPKAVFEEYLLRSHGRTSQPFTSARWQDWSWDQLLVPHFVVDFDFVPRLEADSDSSSSIDGT
ncbi:hypothetical protein DXG01_010213 [Tephrocybe rancida]|nr:hypothetical protein DXG01_010213 [Tephrocybe rancida]